MSGRALLYVQRARTQLAVDQQLNPLEQIVRGQRRNTCGRKIADAEFERFARGFPIRDVSFALSFAFALPQPRQLRIELPDGAAGSNPARVIGDADTRAELHRLARIAHDEPRRNAPFQISIPLALHRDCRLPLSLPHASSSPATGG